MYYESLISKVEIAVYPDDPTRKTRISGTVNTTEPGIKRIIVVDRLSFDYIGSSIVRDDYTWEVNAEYPTDNGLMIICTDESGNFNADIYDFVSLCNVTHVYGTQWETALISSNKYKYRYFPATQVTKYPWPVNEIIEDIKKNITQIQVDTLGLSGHFEDVSNVPVTVGPGNTVERVIPSTRIITDEIAQIKSITGDGSADNDVLLYPVELGHTFNSDIFGDGSCLIHLPFVSNENDLVSSYQYLNKGYSLESGGPFSYSKYLLNTSPGTAPRIAFWSNWDIDPGDYTFSFWINFIDIGQRQGIFGASYKFFFEFLSGYIRYARSNSANAGISTSGSLTSGQSIVKNTWYHLAFSLGSSGITGFVNGVQRGNYSGNYQWVNPTNLHTKVHNTLGIIGFSDKVYSEWVYEPDQYTSICNFRVFNRRLSGVSEAETLYNELPAGGGIHQISSLRNIDQLELSVSPVEKVTNEYNTLIISQQLSDNRELKGDTVTNVEVDLVEVKDYVTAIVKGSYFNCTWFSAIGNYSSYYPYEGFNDNHMYQYNGWFLTMTQIQEDQGTLWFQIDFPQEHIVSAISFRTLNYNVSYDYPTSLKIYTSDTSEFVGEEKYAGTCTITGATTYNEMTDWGYFSEFVKARTVRFYITGRSTIYSINASRNVSFQDVYFQVKIPKTTEMKKGRSIIVDIADNHGDDTYVGVRAICPTVGGYYLDVVGWDFYQTSFHTASYTYEAMKAFDARQSFIGNDSDGICWISQSGNITNQRIIAVAPEDFYYDDIYIINYINSTYSDTDRGAKNTKIQISTDEITNITYGAAVSNSEVFHDGVLDRLYASSAESTSIYEWTRTLDQGNKGYIVKNKPITVRALAFDFSANYGSNYMGIRKIEFWLRGKRVYLYNYNSDGSSWWPNQEPWRTFYPTIIPNSSAANRCWLSGIDSVTNQRITITFGEQVKFDTIRFVNYHNSGSWLDRGVADITIYGSLEPEEPPVTYATNWSGSFTVVPFTEVRRHWEDDSSYIDWMKVYPVQPKTDIWSARSVVFDFHSNHGGENIGLSHILIKRNGLDIPYKSSWAVYASAEDTNLEAVDAVGDLWDPFTTCQDNRSWRAPNATTARIVIVFEEIKQFDEIQIANWWRTSEDLLGVENGVNKITVQITDTILTVADAQYNQSVTGGVIIYEGSVRKKQRYNDSRWSWPFTVCKKQSLQYSKDLALLIHSDTTDADTTFIDSSPYEYNIDTVGTIDHSTDQQQIGASSIDTRLGYLSVNSLRMYSMDMRRFRFASWIYPTSITGEQGIISQWLNDPVTATVTKQGFGGYTVGTSPTDFIEMWNVDSGTFEIVAGGEIGANMLDTTATQAARYAIGWDSLGSVTDGEFIGRFYWSGTNFPTPHWRASGGIGTETGWTLWYSSNNLRLAYMINGSVTDVSTYATTFNQGSWYRFRISFSGTTHKASFWPDNAVEPPWMVEATSTQIQTAGLLCFQNYQTSFQVDFMGYSTNPDANQQFSLYEGEWSQKGYKFGVENGNLTFEYSPSGETTTKLTSTGSIPVDTWSWVEARRIGDRLRFYIGTSLDSTHSLTTDIHTSQRPLTVGTFDEDTANCFPGYFDEVIVEFDDLEGDQVPSPPAVQTQIIVSMPDPALNVYFSVSFTATQVTFWVWYSSAWRAIASSDEAIHGNVADSDWYFRDNADTWSKTGIDNNSCAAISAAIEAGANNQMTKTDIESLIEANWSDTNGFNTSGNFNLAATFYKESDSANIYLTDFKVNDTKYWLSEAIDLEKIVSEIGDSFIDWVARQSYETRNFKDDIATSTKVYAMISGDAAWTECTKGQAIPVLPETMDTTGVFLYLKVEVPESNITEGTKDFAPTIFVEIE